MSQEQADYVTEAMKLLNGEPAAIIEQPRKRLVLRDGLGEEWTVAWVKLSTAFKPHIKEIRGAPLAVWLYIALSVNKQGVSFPSINKIADDTGYSRNGVMDAIKILEEKGYMKVRRGEKRFNLYEPEFAAIGKMNEPSDESTQFTSLLLSPDESTFSPNESSTVDSNKRLTRENKKGDLIDGILFFGKQATQRGEDKTEELLQEIERGLKINIARTTKNQAVARRILTDGRPFGQGLVKGIRNCGGALLNFIFILTGI